MYQYQLLCYDLLYLTRMIYCMPNFLCGCVGAYEYNRTSLLGRPKMKINFFFRVPRWKIYLIKYLWTQLAWFVIHTVITVLVNILSQKRKDDCVSITSQVTILYMEINVYLKNLKNLPSHVSLILHSHVSLNSTGLYLIVMVMIPWDLLISSKQKLDIKTFKIFSNFLNFLQN